MPIGKDAIAHSQLRAIGHAILARGVMCGCFVSEDKNNFVMNLTCLWCIAKPFVLWEN